MRLTTSPQAVPLADAPRSTFSKLFGQQSGGREAVAPADPEDAGADVSTQLFDVPTHTLPPMAVLADAFLDLLLADAEPRGHEASAPPAPQPEPANAAEPGAPSEAIVGGGEAFIATMTELFGTDQPAGGEPVGAPSTKKKAKKSGSGSANKPKRKR